MGSHLKEVSCKIIAALDDFNDVVQKSFSGILNIEDTDLMN